MLEDVQERLVYRTYIYIRTEILQFNPSPGDLAYPDKLLMMEVGGYIIIIYYSIVYLTIHKLYKIQDINYKIATTKLHNWLTNYEHKIFL